MVPCCPAEEFGEGLLFVSLYCRHVQVSWSPDGEKHLPDVPHPGTLKDGLTALACFFRRLTCLC